jgi:hypothetical protein
LLFLSLFTLYFDTLQASFTLDESGLNETANDSQTEDESAKEPKDEETVFKKEEPQSSASANAEDDDDVIVLPSEEPVITEITDEVEAGGQQMTDPSEDVEMQDTIIDDDVMIQEPKIETQIVNDDDDSNSAQCTSGDTNMLPFIVKIKEEPKDNGYENQADDDDDAFIEVTSINEDLMLGKYTHTCQTTHILLMPTSFKDDGQPHAHSPFQAALIDENAVFDESPLFSHDSNHESPELNDDNNSRPEGGEPLVGGNRNIKIVLSSLAQNNLSNKSGGSHNFVNNEQNENSNLDANNKFIDSNSNDLQSDDRSGREESTQENTELPYTVKESLQGFVFEKNPATVKRGIENSGLCSIM